MFLQQSAAKVRGLQSIEKEIPETKRITNGNYTVKMGKKVGWITFLNDD